MKRSNTTVELSLDCNSAEYKNVMEKMSKQGFEVIDNYKLYNIPRWDLLYKGYLISGRIEYTMGFAGTEYVLYDSLTPSHIRTSIYDHGGTGAFRCIFEYAARDMMSRGKKEKNARGYWKLIREDSVFDVKVCGKYQSYTREDYKSFADTLWDYSPKMTVKPYLSDINSLQYSDNLDIFEEEEKIFKIKNGRLFIRRIR